MGDGTADEQHATLQELWNRLLTLGPAGDEDAQFELVAELNRLGEPDALNRALDGLRSLVVWERTAAAWVLGEHGFREEYPYREIATGALVAAARAESEDEARATMVRSLTRAGSAGNATDVLAHRHDRSVAVRLEVAAGISNVFGGEEISPAAVDALITLTDDDDPDVRDWATFSLGTLSDLDGPAIRAALTARIDDPGDGGPDGGMAIREEALLGLARRKDPLAFERLLGWLTGPVDDVTDLVIEAAEVLGDVRLLPALEAVKRQVTPSAQAQDPLDRALAVLRRRASP